MSNMIPRIIGTGWEVPKKIRKNDDPIFDWLHANLPDQHNFIGYDIRHVLSDDENLMTIMVPAAQKAMKAAGITAKDVDLLIGLGSIGTYMQPNDLSLLHKELGLPDSTWVIPVGNDYSNYGSSLLIADGLLRAGRANNILICLGDNWTQNVDYHTPQSISAADGAGAAVMALSSDKSKFHVKDYCTVTDTAYYGTMYTAGLELTANPPIQGYGTVYSPHFFQITQEGGIGFNEFGEKIALTAVTKLLANNSITGADISFMPHQTSQALINYWLENLSPSPAQVLSPLTQFANTTVACHALAFAYYEEMKTIEKDLVVMMALGPDMHSNAMLLQRG